MKKKQLLINIFIFTSILKGYSQNLIHIENGAKFYLNPKGHISILQKANGTIIESTPTFDENTFKWDVIQKDITSNNNELKSIDLKNIKQLTPDQFHNIFKDKRIVVNNESKQFIFIQLNDYTFAYSTSTEDSDIPRLTCNAHYIVIGQRYITVLTDNTNRIIAYIYSTENGLSVNLLPQQEIIVPDNNIITLTPDEKEKVKNYFSEFYQHYKSILIGNKFKLSNRNNRPVKPDLFDKIIIGDTDILTQKGEEYKLYSKTLTFVDIGNIQVAYEFVKARSTYIEAIVDDKHIWIKNGKKLHEEVSSFDWALYGRQEKPTNIKYSFEEYLSNDFKLVLHPQNRFSKPTYEDSIVLNSYKPLHEYQDIVFANHFPYIGQVYDDVHSAEGNFKATLMDDGFNDYKDYAKLKTENVFVQKGNKWGIDSLDLKVSKRFYELVELLPAEFDKLEELHYPMLDIISRGRFDYLGWKRQPVIFHKDKMMGVYPMTKETKYKRVDRKIVGRYFYRATLFNGKGAWLDVMSGKEYIDKE